MSTFLRICRPARVCLVPLRLPAQGFGSQSTRPLSDRVERVDRVNPPASTLPAPVDIPAKEDYDSTVKYAWHTGKAYLSFFKTGIKNVWANSRAARELRRTKGDDLSRAEFQLIVRSKHDMSRLPIFAVLLLLLGEWTPAVAPFMAGVFPKTCRPPIVEEGLLRRAEEQRAFSRQRMNEVIELLPPRYRSILAKDPWGFLSNWKKTISPGLEGAVIVSQVANAHQFKWSCRYDLYTKLMYRIRKRTTYMSPMAQALAFRMFGKREQRRRNEHYIYLVRDSELLLRDGGPQKLSAQEVRIACMERGINVLGKSEAENRQELVDWLEKDVKSRDSQMREAMPEMKQSLDQWMEVEKSVAKVTDRDGKKPS